MSVIDAMLRFSQNGEVIDHIELREELIRQLEAGTVTASEIAEFLGVSRPRVTEMKGRTRRIQQHELVPLAQKLGFDGLPSVETLAALLEYATSAVPKVRDQQAALRLYARGVRAGLRWIARDSSNQRDPDFLEKQVRPAVVSAIEAALPESSQAA